jgi:hypothetical protein
MRNVWRVKPSLSVIKWFPRRRGSCNLTSLSATKRTLRASARPSSAYRFIGLFV